MLNDRLKRTIALLGKENVAKIAQTSVMIIGCGAVGGYALEMIARLGFNKIAVVDFDTFEESNVNRQILALTSTLGCKKSETARARVLEINPKAEVSVFDRQVKPNNMDFIFEAKPDFVIDAIDDLEAKAELIAFLKAHNIRFISAMGAALKRDVSLLRTANLGATEGCAMAKKLRGILKAKGLDLKTIPCVYSPEAVKICKDENGANVLGSLPMVPAAMGIKLASWVLEETLKPQAVC